MLANSNDNKNILLLTSDNVPPIKSKTHENVCSMSVKGGFHVYPEKAAAGLWSTATDLAKVLIDLQYSLQGKPGTMLSKQMAVQMLTPISKDGMALGMFADDSYFYHGGRNEGYDSNFISHKSGGYGAVVLTNSEHPRFAGEVIDNLAKKYNWKGY